MSDFYRIPREINPDEPTGLTPDMNPVDDATLHDEGEERLEREAEGDETSADDDEAGEPA